MDGGIACSIRVAARATRTSVCFMAWLRPERLSPRLKTSKKPLRWAAPLLKLPGAIVMTAVGIAAVVLAAAASWWLLVPAADWLAHHDVGSAKGPLLQTARDAARGRLLTLGAGLFAAGVLIYTARTFGLSREGQVTDRYTKAIEQLGSDKLDVRIGGIYALERVARDSARDHPTVMEVLTAFVREHSREQWPLPEHDTDPAPPPERRADVQAALTVIGRRHASRDTRPIDLARADLTGADLTGALLFRADLTGAHLTGADLTGADLASALLADADLTGAHLTGADLSGADLTGAHLAHADLRVANLAAGHLAIYADLTGADLTGADLTGAHTRPGAAIPEGWQLDTDSGRLKPTDTNSGGTTTN